MQNIITSFMGYKKVFSIFPEFYNYREFAPFVLRLSIGAIFLFSGWSQFSKRGGIKILNISIGLLKMITGAFLIIGMYTQMFALIGLIVSLLGILSGIKNREGIDNIAYNFLMFIISISILLTGPGMFAFDLSL